MLPSFSQGLDASSTSHTIQSHVLNGEAIWLWLRVSVGTMAAMDASVSLAQFAEDTSDFKR